MPPAPAAPKEGASPPNWLQAHRTEVFIGVGGIVITIALYMRSKNSAAAATSTTPSTSVVPSTADTTQSDLYNGLESQINGLASAVSASTAAQAAPGTAAAGAPGQGAISVDGAQYVDLGTLGNGGNFYGYNVGGSGAPIFAETPGSSSLVTNMDLAGLPSGTELLTPESWASQVSATPGAAKYS